MDGTDHMPDTAPIVARDALQLPEPYRAPGTDHERQVAAIWCAVLQLDRVGLDDDFFDLGGDSLSATEIANAVTDAFDVPFQPGQLLTLSTVAALAQHLAKSGTAPRTRLPAHVALASAGGGDAPVFLVHGIFGLSFPSPAFFPALAARHPIYILNAIGFYDDTPTPRTLEATARAYLDSVRRVAPAGGYHLIGMCAGGCIAHEMGRQAELAGDPALSVTLIDPRVKRLAGLRRSTVLGRWRRFLAISGQEIGFSVQRALGMIGSETTDLAATRRHARILSQFIGRTDGNAELWEGLQRQRIASAQKVLDVMFKATQSAPWRGPVNVLMSAEKHAKVRPEVWARFTPTRHKRIIEVGHFDLFDAAAAETGAALAEIIDAADR